jgi:hypothetical protein
VAGFGVIAEGSPNWTRLGVPPSVRFRLHPLLGQHEESTVGHQAEERPAAFAVDSKIANGVAGTDTSHLRAARRRPEARVHAFYGITGNADA